MQHLRLERQPPTNTQHGLQRSRDCCVGCVGLHGYCLRCIEPCTENGQWLGRDLCANTTTDYCARSVVHALVLVTFCRLVNSKITCDGEYTQYQNLCLRHQKAHKVSCKCKSEAHHWLAQIAAVPQEAQALCVHLQ